MDPVVLEEPGKLTMPAAIGRAAELELAALLIERGHSVAQVLVDDGIDLVVDYCIKVQVKTTSVTNVGGAPRVGFDTHSHVKRDRPGYYRGLNPRVDILAAKFRPTGAWWFIPRDILGDRPCVTLNKKVAHYRDAWELFSTFSR